VVRKSQQGNCEDVAGEYHVEVGAGDDCVVDDGTRGNGA
jgi:hypothetical protein